MERAPKQEEVLDFERAADGAWEYKRDSAPEEAEALIASIEDFETMSAKEQLRALQAFLASLAGENENRFLVDEIAKRMNTIEATDSYQAAMDRLEQTRPTGGRVLTEA